MTQSNHEMHASGIPCWVTKAVQEKIDRLAVGFARRGYYEITVERESNSCPDCEIEVWRARIDADTWDYWDNEKDPTKQREPITWEQFNIYQI